MQKVLFYWSPFNFSRYQRTLFYAKECENALKTPSALSGWPTKPGSKCLGAHPLPSVDGGDRRCPPLPPRLSLPHRPGNDQTHKFVQSETKTRSAWSGSTAPVAVLHGRGWSGWELSVPPPHYILPIKCKGAAITGITLESKMILFRLASMGSAQKNFQPLLRLIKKHLNHNHGRHYNK